MKVTVLGSGSSGNSTVIENGGSAILMDAGFSCRSLERRLAIAGIRPEKIRAIVISHEHSDHTRGAALLSKKHNIPIYLSEGTDEAGRLDLDKAFGTERFVVGHEFSVDGFSIKPFRIPHDAVDPAAFVIERDGLRVGVGTDLGYITNLLENYFTDLDLLVFESNYDPVMLRDGPYPWFLKQRIASRNGHLSNPEMSEFVRSTLSSETRHIILAHLSRTNNNPNLVMAHCKEALSESGNEHIRIHIADQDECSETIDLED